MLTKKVPFFQLSGLHQGRNIFSFDLYGASTACVYVIRYINSWQLWNCPKDVTVTQLRFHRFDEYCCNFICVRILESVYHFHALSCINYEGIHISCALVTELITFYLKLGNLHSDIFLERQLSTESDTYL